MSGLGLRAQSPDSLIDAVRGGDLAGARDLLASGADPDGSTNDGTRAIHWAVRADDGEMIRALLAAGADANLANRYGMTPLHLAAVNGNVSTIRLLLEAGADANLRLPEGETALMTAARTGVADAIRALLEAGARVGDTESWHGEDALMWAAAENHGEAVRVLIDHGADPNRRSSLEEFEKRRNGQSIMPLGGWTPLMYAARRNAREAGRALVESGADADLVDPDGATALVIAIINAHYDFAAMLLDLGADPNVVDDAAGMGPLYAAIDMNRLAVGHGRPNPVPSSLIDAPGIIRMLLDHGADPNARLKGPIMQRQHTAGDATLGEGATPFMRAAKSGDIGSLRALVAFGADPDLVMPSGNTALMYAAGLGWRNGSPLAPSYDQGSEAEAVEALEFLLNMGADLDGVNDSGDTALHAGVAGRSSAAIVRFLLEAGADPEVPNMRDQSPRDVARSRGTDEIRALLGVSATP